MFTGRFRIHAHQFVSTITIDIQPCALLAHKVAVFLHFVGAAIHFVAGIEANFSVAVINVVHSRY